MAASVILSRCVGVHLFRSNFSRTLCASSSELPIIEVELRDENLGSVTSRKLRRQGLIPCAVYGFGITGPNVIMKKNILDRELNRRGASFLATTYLIQLPNETIRAVPQQLQRHPVSDVPISVNFMRHNPELPIRVKVPLRFVNHEKSPGIKRGGLLNHICWDVEVLIICCILLFSWCKRFHVLATCPLSFGLT
jgi:large subunit ribosomal protein L25